MLGIHISRWAEPKRSRAHEHARFMGNHHTNDHIFTLISTIEEAKGNKRNVYYCFMDFRNAFGKGPQLLFTKKIKVLVLPPLVVSLVMTLYETIVGKVETRIG
jgi:hypothetical protein